MATNTIWPWFPMLHQALPPPRWTNLLFTWFMCLLTVHAHRMGTWNVPIQPLLTGDMRWDSVFFPGWFWGWGTSEMQLARQKRGGKTTPQSWRPPLPCSRHGVVPLAPPPTTINQHAAWQVYVVKTREYYCFYYLLAILRRDALPTGRACVFAGCISGQRWE